MRLRPDLILVLLCVASLADVPWVRTGEQLLAPALLPAEALIGGWMPAVEGLEEGGPEVQAAAQAWAAWLAAVAERPPLLVAGRRPCVVPVIAHDEARQELLLRVPDVDLLRDSPVTHRGTLVGFLLPWRRGGERVVVDGRARVALLGHPQARPVAATWADRSLEFLVASRNAEPTVMLRSRRIQPLAGQLALSRDALALGDSLPAGLALGRVAPVEVDLPGGALALQTRDEPALERFWDPADLTQVAIEAPVEAELSPTVIEGRLLRTARGRHRWHLDRGLLHGVGRGDGVIQEGRWVGRVQWVGPLTAVVLREAPEGLLLVGAPSGALVPVGSSAGAWPAGLSPRPGLPVYCGDARAGGLSVGRLGPTQHDRLTVELGPFDPGRPVTVLPR